MAQDAAHAVQLLAEIHDQGVEDDFPITFALESKLNADDVR